jgi:hypothetical protein
MIPPILLHYGILRFGSFASQRRSAIRWTVLPAVLFISIEIAIGIEIEFHSIR